MNIPKPRIKLLIVIAAAGLVFAGGITWWLANHDKNAKQQPVAQTSPAESQPATSTPEPNVTPTPAQTNTNASKSNSTTPSPTPAPQPTPANITHPTAANCPATGQKITVYASVEAGTPAYLDHPVYRDSSNKVVKTFPYKSQISNVFCDDSKTALFQEVAHNYYYRFNFSDVSVTLP